LSCWLTFSLPLPRRSVSSAELDPRLRRQREARAGRDWSLFFFFLFSVVLISLSAPASVPVVRMGTFFPSPAAGNLEGILSAGQMLVALVIAAGSSRFSVPNHLVSTPLAAGPGRLAPPSCFLPPTNCHHACCREKKKTDFSPFWMLQSLRLSSPTEVGELCLSENLAVSRSWHRRLRVRLALDPPSDCSFNVGVPCGALWSVCSDARQWERLGFCWPELDAPENAGSDPFWLEV
jgi:hypothetical protein